MVRFCRCLTKMVRKTRRRLRGGQDKHSPLARRLMTFRHEKYDELPRMKRSYVESALERNAMLARANITDDDAEYRRLLERGARMKEGTDETRRAVLGVVRKARTGLRDEYEGAENREYATAQARAHKKGGRKTRRRLRGGQDKPSPLERALAVRRKLEMDVTPEMRASVADYNRKLANLNTYAATATKPWELKGIAAARAQLERSAPSPEDRRAVAKADAAKSALLQTVNDPSVGVPRKRHG